MISWAHHRWQIEQGYQQLKEELGLDHFEGRLWRGLHHHLTLCFLAYGFLLLLRQKKNAHWTLPVLRRWLHLLFSFTQCPLCQAYHLARRIPLFSSA